MSNDNNGTDSDGYVGDSRPSLEPWIVFIATSVGMLLLYGILAPIFERFDTYRRVTFATRSALRSFRRAIRVETRDEAVLQGDPEASREECSICLEPLWRAPVGGSEDMASPKGNDVEIQGSSPSATLPVIRESSELQLRVPSPVHQRFERVLDSVPGSTHMAHNHAMFRRLLHAHEVHGNDAVVTLRSCEHKFHYECLAGWFRRGNSTCPVCRRSYGDLGGTNGLGHDAVAFVAG